MEQWKITFPSSGQYFNIEVYHCQEIGETKVTETSSTTQAPVTERPPLIKNVLGENLFSSLQEFLSHEEKVIDLDDTEVDVVTNPCELIAQYKISVLHAVIGLVLILFVLISVTILLYGFVQKHVLKVKSSSICKEPVIIGEPIGKESDSVENIGKTDEVVNEDSKVSEAVTELPPQAQEVPKSIGSPLHYQGRLCMGQNCPAVYDTSEFLSSTTEKLFLKLDRLLLKNVPPEQSQSQMTLATPRLARRALQRRQRIGSSPSLPAYEANSDTSDSRRNEKELAWIYFKNFCTDVGWMEARCLSVNDSKYDRKVQRLLHYYQRVCTTNTEHWNTATLIANYALLLLKTELEKILCSNGYRFIEFRSTGSSRFGSKVGRPNQFDVHMIIQPPLAPNVVIEETENEIIPPGHLLVVVDLPKDSSIPVREMAKQVKVNKNFKICLSSKEFARSAEELINICLQTLYTKYRSLMDRLPFQIRRAPTADLNIAIDTKNLLSLGLSEIKLSLIPVLPLPINGWYQAGKVYAKALQRDQEIKHRPTMISDSVSPEFLWQLSLEELQSQFMEDINFKMKHAGIFSCHFLCFMILKALLTRGTRNTLLDRGVFQSYHISTVLSFLLLESKPSQWSFEHLHDRFSDVIHFLKSSFSNGRLPNFFINNPYLFDKMPAVAGNKILTRKRQQNLLSDMRPESLEKCLEYMEDCLRESGLQECVKGDYSGDMWEYEFFVY